MEEGLSALQVKGLCWVMSGCIGNHTHRPIAIAASKILTQHRVELEQPHLRDTQRWIAAYTQVFADKPQRNLKLAIEALDHLELAQTSPQLCAELRRHAVLDSFRLEQEISSLHCVKAQSDLLAFKVSLVSLGFQQLCEELHLMISRRSDGFQALQAYLELHSISRLRRLFLSWFEEMTQSAFKKEERTIQEFQKRLEGKAWDLPEASLSGLSKGDLDRIWKTCL
jgi:hypothetical protein